MRKNWRIGLTAILAISLTGLVATPGQAAVKLGAKCSSVGLTSIVGTTAYTCSKSGKKLVWKSAPLAPKKVQTPTATPSATPTPTPTPTPKSTAALASKSNPAPVGTAVKIGDMLYTMNKVSFNIDSLVCAANGTNTGCTVDATGAGVVDRTSTTAWVAATLTAQNTGKLPDDAAGFLTTFDLVLPNGQLLKNEELIFDYPLLSDLKVAPGASATGPIVFLVPKTLTTLKSNLILHDATNGDTVDYYFQFNW